MKPVHRRLDLIEERVAELNGWKCPRCGGRMMPTAAVAGGADYARLSDDELTELQALIEKSMGLPAAGAA